MRLICGFLHLEGAPAEAPRLASMIQAMIEPGLSPRIARIVDGPLAMARLDFARSETSASGDSALPSGASGLILAADARIDAPERFDDAGLARFLAEAQEQGLAPLSGDFALAAWDPRRRTLWCARDGMGIRPLFFAHLPGKWFAFASMPAALHASGRTDRQLDRPAALAALLRQPRDPGQSVFAGIRRVPPGTWLRVGASGLHQGRHWQLDPATAGTRRIAPDEAARQLATLVESAVKRRLPATGPVAAHLSGGLDSSALAILAARDLSARGERLFAYAIVPAPYAGHDFGAEGPFIAPTLAQESNIVWTPKRVTDPAAFVVPRMDSNQLFPADPRHPEIAIFADAARQGADVLLSGWGGDEGASYTHRAIVAEALLAGRWRYVRDELQAYAALRAQSVIRSAWQELAPYLLPPGLYRGLRRLYGKAPGPDLVRDVLGLLRPEIVRGVEIAYHRLPPDARRIRFQLLGGPGIARRAEHWALAGARYGIAPAFPLLDRDVVTFALSLPSRLFLNQGRSRHVFREAMAGILPEAIRCKPGKADIAAEAPIYPAIARAALLDRLAQWRRTGSASDWVDPDRIAAQLQGLPDADMLATAMTHGGPGVSAMSRSFALLHVFHFLAFVEEAGGR